MTNHPQAPNLYSTADLGIAVYLFTIGSELINTTLKGPQRLVFHFKRTDDTEAQVANYLKETGQAPAKCLFENYRALRALTYAQTNNLK